MTDEANEVWFNATGAAHRLGLSTRELARMRRAGTGPAFHHVLGSVRYWSDDLDAYLMSCEVRSDGGCFPFQR